jgi:hypothetical protein
MKTAMQDFIEKLENNKHLESDWEDFKIELLEKEKEQIVNAYDRGYKACDLDEALEINKTMFSGGRYYNQTYNQNK